MDPALRLSYNAEMEPDSTQLDAKGIRVLNLRTLIAEAGTQKNLAQESGISPAYLSQILSDTTPRQMGDSVARRLERGMRKPYGWMDRENPDIYTALAIHGCGAASMREGDNPGARYGSGADDPHEADLRANILVAVVPHLAGIHVKARVEARTGGGVAGAPQVMRPNQPVGPRSYAMSVPGDSMAPTLVHGATVVVDPDREPHNGSIVAYQMLEDSEPILRIYNHEGGRVQLLAANTVFAAIHAGPDAFLCGVVCESVTRH